MGNAKRHKILERNFQAKPLLLAAAIGALVLGTASVLVGWLDRKDAISDLILVWTALIVVWYTLEAHELTVISEQQVALQEEIMMNNFLPTLVPSDTTGHKIEGEWATIVVDNIGAGIARNIEFRVDGITVLQGVTIRAGASKIPVEDTNNNIGLESVKETIIEMDAELVYEDVYGRRFRTVGLKFRRDPNVKTRLILDSSRWEFKKA